MDVERMQVVILAGGAGERLRPYTTVLPKPLMPLGEASVLEILLRQLQRDGFRRITLAVSYLAELVQASFGDGSRLGLDIRYSREARPLSTAGPLALIGDLTETFLVVNGDILTTIDFGALLRFHLERKAAATIAASRRRIEIDFGVLETDERHDLVRYVEKPTYDYLVSMGINVLEPRALRYIGEGERLDMPSLLERMREAGERVAVHETDCLWLDIGRKHDYEKAIEVFHDHAERFVAGVEKV